MRVNIYIRKEDEEAWNSLENKPDWLHRALGGDTSVDALPVMVDRIEQATDFIKPVDSTKPARFSQGVCKIHGTPLDTRGKCLQKGCKYS